MNNERRDGVSRRELLGGGLFLGAMLLTGCASPQRSASLPNPRWPKDNTWGTSPPPAPANRDWLPTDPPATAGTTDLVLPDGVITRAQWTRAGVARPAEAFNMGPISRITVHHDGMPPAALATAGAVASRLEQIRRSHVDRGWADIGYHFVIDPAGRVWEARNARLQGAHVKDNNENNLGILVLGNFDEQRPTPQALAQLDRFVAFQMSRNRVAISRVYTHQEIKPTACPGRNLQAYMVRTRSSGGSLAAALRGTTLVG